MTVSGQSPVVDITSTKTATNFDAKELASMPSARDFWAILAAAPAVQMQRIDVGGSAAGTQTGYSTYDTKADQHRPMVEGIVNTEGTNAAGFYYDYGSFDEVSVATGTNTAEMPWPGVMSQFISKSGGNTYHGKIYADYESENVQSRNIDADQIKLGLKAGGGLTETDLNRLHSYYDLNGDVGGYLKPDKLWWYGSLRDQKVQSLLPNFPVQPFETHLSNISAKGDVRDQHEQQADRVRDVGQEDAAEPARHLPGRRDGGRPHRAPIRPGTRPTGPTPTKASGTASSAIARSSKSAAASSTTCGRTPATRTRRRTPTSAPTSSAAAIATAGSTSRRATRCSGSFSYFKDGWGGSHNFKIGGEIFDERFDYLARAGRPRLRAGRRAAHPAQRQRPAKCCSSSRRPPRSTGCEPTAPISPTRGGPDRG